MVSPLSTTIIKVHLQCPSTAIQTSFFFFFFFTQQQLKKVSMCAAEHGSKERLYVLKTSMKYKLKKLPVV